MSGELHSCSYHRAAMHISDRIDTKTTASYGNKVAVRITEPSFLKTAELVMSDQDVTNLFKNDIDVSNRFQE